MFNISKKSIQMQFKLVLACLTVLGLVLSLLAYRALGNLTAKTASLYAEGISEKFNYEISSLIQHADAILSSLLFDKNIESLMEDPFTPQFPDYLDAFDTQNTAYSLMNPELSDIALVTDDFTRTNFYSRETLRQFARKIGDSRDTVCLGIHRATLLTLHDDTPYLVFAKNVYGMHNMSIFGKHLGCIIISLNLAESQISMPSKDPVSTRFILRDKWGQPFRFNCTPEQYVDLLSQSRKVGGGVWPAQKIFKTKDYMVYCSDISSLNLTAISAMDLKSLNSDARVAGLGLAAAMTVSFVFIGLLMYSLLTNMVNPLRKLHGFIDKIRKNPAEAEVSAIRPEGCAEVRSLSETFNAMLREQSHLNKELQEATVNLYQTKLGLKQAELDFLRSQINPHFLYNTLEAIQAAAASRGNPEIADAAGALGTLFRYNVKGKATVALSRELETIKAYLIIQKLRFGDKIEVIENLRADTLDLMVMKLLLQPIVENAVYHGLEPKVGQGTIFLTSRRDGDTLIISVYDDGVGIPADRLEALQRALTDEAAGKREITHHIGLLNVQHRLRLFYGKGYGLTVESRENEGTKVMMRLPVRTQEDEAYTLEIEDKS